MVQAQIGVIGLGVMGANIARNFANHGFETVVYNRTADVTEAFLIDHGNDHLSGEKELAVFVSKLEVPRRILIMVKAGAPVDSVIQSVVPYLGKGDVLIDGGNSNWNDTLRREKALKAQGFNFVGMGVSGGEEGALNGPSMMPGGSKEAWCTLQPMLEAVAAKDFSGGPCVTHIGENGAGHYVKMVHNGIEYAVMQVMAEGYDLLRFIYQLSADEIASIFATFNQGKLKSFLFEIATTVLAQKDDLTENFLVDLILDKAGQKGTGRWTAIDALERGAAIPSIDAAVTARILSGGKDRRLKLSSSYPGRAPSPQVSLEEFIIQLENALYSAMLISYAQGYDLIQQASVAHNWNIDLAEVSRIWEGGCIIRADLLNFLHQAYKNANAPEHLFEIPEIEASLTESILGLRTLTTHALLNHVPVPALAASLTYFDALTQANGSANFIQGLRDFFGAHTYERTDRDGIFHTNWTS